MCGCVPVGCGVCLWGVGCVCGGVGCVCGGGVCVCVCVFWVQELVQQYWKGINIVENLYGEICNSDVENRHNY